MSNGPTINDDHKRATPETYKRIFEQNPDGILIFEDLTRLFLRGAVLSGGIDAIRRSDFNAGTTKVLLHIDRKIKQANGEDTSGYDNDEENSNEE